ncbi:MAG: DUF1292 domain-containing protein [bacterium]|nr:DUF1292 domain-containing protein [bacterium]
MEIEYVIIDDKRFGIINEITNENTTYVFLANLEDPTEQLIRKYTKENQEDLIPLENDAEFDFALSLFNE